MMQNVTDIKHLKLHFENCFTLVTPVEEIKTKKMCTAEEKGSWEEKKGKLKQKFAVLTHDDLMFAGGNIEELYSRLQIKLGITRAEFQEIIESL